MEQRIQKSILLSLWSLLVSILLIGCSEAETEQTPETEPAKYHFQLATAPGMSDAIKAEGLSAYLFNNNLLVKVFNNITLTGTNCELYATANCSVYFLSNFTDTATLETIRVGETTLKEFLLLRNNPQEPDNNPNVGFGAEPPIFYSGMVKLPKQLPALGEEPITVNLKRSMSRLDLDLRNPSITVSRIIIEGASSSTTLFPNADRLSPASEPLISLDRIIPTDMASPLIVNYLYESDKPVNIRVYIANNGQPSILNFDVPNIQRNKIYNLQFTGIGATITSSLTVIPWEEGSSTGTTPDTNGQTLLSKSLSTLAPGVEIDEAQRAVSVSSTGGDFTLAFVSDAEVELVDLTGGGSSLIIPTKPQRTENKEGRIINYFDVKVLPQAIGNLSYVASFKIKRTGQQYLADRFAISVAISKSRVSEVTLGGVTWMAFNATTRNLEDQIYQVEGASVEEMYRTSWGSTIGGLFQWGRIYKYTPWLSGSNNAGGQSQNNPWINDEFMPCPNGYRVPSRAELRALLPPGTVLPGSYLYNGEAVTATLNTSTPEAVRLGTVSGKGRYLSIKSDVTGATLHIPLAGQKGDKSWSNNPGFGAGFTLWASSLYPPLGGWSHTAMFWPGINGTTYTIAADDALQAEGFASVRCIKRY